MLSEYFIYGLSPNGILNNKPLSLYFPPFLVSWNICYIFPGFRFFKKYISKQFFFTFKHIHIFYFKKHLLEYLLSFLFSNSSFLFVFNWDCDDKYSALTYLKMLVICHYTWIWENNRENKINETRNLILKNILNNDKPPARLKDLGEEYLTPKSVIS